MGTLAELQRVCVITHGSWDKVVTLTKDGQKLDATVAALHEQHTLLAVTSGKQVLDILSAAGDNFMDCGKYECANTQQLLDLVFISYNVAGLAPKYESDEYAPALDLMHNMHHFLEPLELEIPPSMRADDY